MTAVKLEEQQEVLYRRYKEARLFGLTRLEARLFAESDRDIGELRVLQAKGCSPALAAKILI